MKFKSITQARFLRQSFLLLACAACIGQVHAAGPEPSTSAYATIQPNLAGTGYVYTLSYVAGEDHISSGPRNFEGGYFGNGGATLDNVNILGDSTWGQLSLDGFSRMQVVRFTSSAQSSLAPFHTQHVTSQPNTRVDSSGFTRYTVQWADPMTATNTALGFQSPTVATPQYNDVGLYTTADNIVFGSGIQGVTGIFGTDPGGAGAATGLGVGIHTDIDGGLTDDFAFMVAGYDTSEISSKTNSPNPVPRTGYLRVEVPYPRQVETSTIVLSTLGTEQRETLTLSGNAGTPQVETATIAGTITGARQVETLTLSGAVTGTAQVETATVVGSITTGGDLQVTVTGAAIAGSPIVLNVPVTAGLLSTDVVNLIRNAMLTTPAINSVFLPNSTASVVTLTKRAPFGANDGTLNIAIANGTADGLTPAPTSADTTAGVAGGGGTLNIIVTAAGMNNSPKTVAVNVLDGETTAQQTVRVVNALNFDPDVTAFFTTSGTTTVILTARTPAANDGTMNVASALVDTTGPAAVTTSVNTTAGVAPSGSGNVLITVTGADIAGSPLAVNVPVLGGDTNVTVATKVRAALATLPAITNFYDVTNPTTTTVRLTRNIAPFTNDAALNIASANGTSAGLTPSATSANTTAGVAGGGGTLNIIVTAAGMTNSPKTVPVTILAGDSTATQAARASNAVNADPDVGAFFSASHSAATLVLTARTAAANDATMNVASALVDTTGPVAVTTSANTTAGVATSVVGGNAIVTVTGALINGGVPLPVNVTLATGDTRAIVATKFAAALNATPAISAFYTASAFENLLLLTKSAAPLFENDTTLNIAYANDTATGLTASATSADTSRGTNPFTDRYIAGVHTNNPAIELTVTTNAAYTPKIAVSGDFDSDLNVDAADLAVAAAGYGGAGIGNRWYRNGDTDADGDVDNKDLGNVIGRFAAAPGTPPTPTGSATLTYDPANGNVKLNATTATGAQITSFQLQTSAATIVTGNYNPVTGGTFNGTYKNVGASVIGDTDTSLAGVAGAAIDLGNIFPDGMDLTQLTAYLTTRVYTGEEGSRQQNLTLALAVAGLPFEDWADTGTLGPVTFDGDTNGDGVKDGLAFLLGVGNPDDDASGNLPTVTEIAGGLVLNFSMLDAASRGTAALSVEHSSDLGIADDWVAVLVPDATPDPQPTGMTFAVSENMNPALNDVVATILASEADDGKLFGRLKATE